MKNKVVYITDKIKVDSLLELYLKNDGFFIIKNNNRKEVLEIILKEEIDLCLIDTNLNSENGYMLCQEIKNIKNDFPIIFLSHCNDEMNFIKAITLGADDFCDKNNTAIEIMVKIKKQLIEYNNNFTRDNYNITSNNDLVMNLSSYNYKKTRKTIDLTPTKFSIVENIYNKEMVYLDINQINSKINYQEEKFNLIENAL